MSNFVLLGRDLLGFALAAPLAALLWILPGNLIASALSKLIPDHNWRGLGPALAFACLPLLDALAITVGGVRLAASLHVVAAVGALGLRPRLLTRLDPVVLGAALAWWVYLAVLYVDFDYEGRLYQSLVVVDLVKHAAVVREIAVSGLPLNDPFFLRNAAAGYYHYFYDGAAVIYYLGGHLIDARMAFVGLAFACGLAFANLLRAFVVELGWQKGSDRRLTSLVILACSVGGLDLLGLWLRWSAVGVLERNSEWWDDEISLFTTSASWVPHHLAAVVACFVGMLSLARGFDSRRATTAIYCCILAAIVFSSSFGLSVWVTLGAAGVLLPSLFVMARRGLLKWLGMLAGTTGIALVLSALQLMQVYAGRAADAKRPLGLWIRDPARLTELAGHPLNGGLYLAVTPFIWALEFGIFAIGSYCFWRSRSFDRGSSLWRLLVCSFVAGLVLNLFVRSTIINNDFGWRVAWFTAFPAMLMTIAVLQRPVRCFGTKITLLTMGGLGMAATAYNAAAARIPPVNSRDTMAYINADPVTDYALARAYRWAATALPQNAVLQHNPASQPRVVDFGLYGGQRTAVADGQAMLFGASSDAVQKRVDQFGSIFNGDAPLSAAAGVHLIVTRADPLWNRLTPSECLYLSDRVCITKLILSSSTKVRTSHPASPAPDAKG